MPAKTGREAERWSRELLKDTPMMAEGDRARREREEAHRAMPKDEQPHMVIFFGMLGYDVIWIGERGGDEALAEKECAWWQRKIPEGLYMVGRTREPMHDDFQVRQQWDLDALTAAILSSYR